MEVYRGDVKDNGYGDNPDVLVDGQGHHVAIVERDMTTFTLKTICCFPMGRRNSACR